MNKICFVIISWLAFNFCIRIIIFFNFVALLTKQLNTYYFIYFDLTKLYFDMLFVNHQNLKKYLTTTSINVLEDPITIVLPPCPSPEK